MPPRFIHSYCFGRYSFTNGISVLITLALCTTAIVFILPFNERRFLLYRYVKEAPQLDEINTSNAFGISVSNNVTSLIPAGRFRYLWCVNHYGPNNQLKDFIKCALLATINNYTLILPHLYPHYADKIRGIQYFDHFYDLNSLKSAVHFVTLDDFVSSHTLSNRSVLTIDCYIQQIELIQARSWYSLNALNSIKTLYKTKILFNHLKNLSRHFDLTEFRMKSNSCSSIFLHIHYTTLRHFFSPPHIHIQKVFEKLHRAPLIRRMAQQTLQLLPEIVEIRKHKADRWVVAVAHFRLGDQQVMNVSSYVKQILALIRKGVQFTHLHIMSSLLNTTEMDHVRKEIPISITTTSDLLRYAHWILDDYLFDILEQEMALRAPVFIGSPKTTYSATVIMQKVYQQQGQVYVFSLRSDQRPLQVTKANVKYFDC